MSRTMNNLKESFAFMKAITTTKIILKTLCTCKVCCLKSHIMNLLLIISDLDLLSTKVFIKTSV